MTPAARYAAAIELLDQIIAGGTPAERCLTHWARQNRYAGSKDRAAIRDHVFDVLRNKRSLAATGGGLSGRLLILGLLRRQGIDPTDVFGAGGYGPDVLTTQEAAGGRAPNSDAEACDIPDWLWPAWEESLAAQAITAAKTHQSRAPVALRVNMRRGSRDDAVLALAADGIATEPSMDVATGLIVTENPRRVAGSAAFRDGLVELQDVASQMAMARLPVAGHAKVLDYCAGGGGKSLALADRHDAQIFAHDIAVDRMRDIAPRAARAGVTITALDQDALRLNGPFDVVLCDAPCSGSGTWRRTPDAKWRLTPEKLNEYNEMQRDVLLGAAPLVGAGGVLAYATCSVLQSENQNIVDAFLAAQAKWSLIDKMQLAPAIGHDGFFLAILQRQG